jgi:hypothetical protein
MTALRVATFNCENLFCRPKILNFDHNDDAREPLNKLVRLNAIVGKARYSDANKLQILTLLGELADFIALNEMRHKLVGRKRFAEDSARSCKSAAAPTGWAASS